MLVMEALHPAMELQQAAAREAAAAAAASAASDAGQPSQQQQLASATAACSPLLTQPQRQDPAAAGAAAAAQQQQHQTVLPPDALLVAWAEAAGDVREALSAVADLVAACGGMGRLQAVLEAEEMRRRFAAAARDLGLALSGLQALRAVAPADVGEDVLTAQRQLAALHFSPSSQAETLAGALLRSATLQRVAPHTDTPRKPAASSSSSGVGNSGITTAHSPITVGGGGGQLTPLLLEALALAGLEVCKEAAEGSAWQQPPAWLEFEVRRMRDGAAAAAADGDPITEFFYHQVLVCLA
jgi:hypothetical protein